MSWVRVECSGGQRYAVPSHGRPTPRLDGLAHLFQEPVRLRTLHTFSSLTPDAAAVSGSVEDGGIEACGGACVMLDQRELGGHLGLTTVAVGDETDSEFPSSAEANLHQLLAQVYAVLRCTNGHGIQLLLDALCTRAPAPLTASAAAEAVVVREDDGGRRVPPALWEARADAAGRSAGAGVVVRGTVNAHRHTSSGAPSNRRFLLNLTQTQESAVRGDLDEDDAAPPTTSLSLQPLQLNAAQTFLTSPPRKKGPAVPAASTPTAMLTARPPLSYAAALRRRSLLFFVPQGVVPLSMLAARVQATQPKSRRSTHKGGTAGATTAPQDVAGGGGSSGLLAAAAGTPGAPPRAVGEVLLDVFARVRTDPRSTDGKDTSSGAATKSSAARCVSHLRQGAQKLLDRSSSWAAVAQTSEESCRLLVWVVARLLAGNERFVRQTRAAALENLLVYDLWATPDTADAGGAGLGLDGAASAHGNGCSVPLVAAYSPSGLLLASSRFSRALHQDDQTILAAVAIDRLARYAAPLHATPTGLSGVLHWTSWPMRATPTRGHAAHGEAVLDVLLITIGDAAAVCLIFPRVPASVAALSPIPSANLRAVVALLETTATATTTAAPAEKAGTPGLSMLEALHTACTQSTAPYSASFHDALFAVTALEDALDKSRSADPPDAVSTAAQPRVAAAHTMATSNTVTTTAATAARAPGKRSRNAVTSALHKLFSCVPVGRRDPSKDIATASRQLCITAAEEQSSAYVQQLSSALGPVLTPPVPPSSASASSRSKTSARVHATAGYAAALLAMPLEVMLGYVAAVVTRNELGVLRPTYELGLHSFYFVQQPQPQPTSKPAKATPCSCAAEAGGSIANKKQKHRNTTHVPQRFAVSFARFHLQQTSCSSLTLPEEWADLTGAPDCAGGSSGGGSGYVRCFEDPSLLLRLNAVGAAAAAASPASAEERSREGRGATLAESAETATQTELGMQVSVVPVWALLQVAPSDSPAAPHDGSDDAASAPAAGDEKGEGADNVHGFVPPSAMEDAQLVTSLHYTYPQRLCVYGDGGAEAPTASPQVPPPRSPVSAAQASALPLPAAAPPPPPLGHTLASSSSLKKVWCTVEAVVNISGDITGMQQDIIVKALHRHALSAAADDKLEHVTIHDGAADALQVDSLPAEWEYAAEAPSKAAALCREVVWSQAAALALLEGASSFK